MYRQHGPTIAGSIAPGVPLRFSRNTYGALALLNGEREGLAIDFGPHNGLGMVAVKDLSTAANNKNNQPVDNFLTQSGTSPKLVLWSDGLYRWSPHNLITRSEDFSNASWAKTGATATAGEITEDTSTGTHRVNQDVTTISGATYTVSVEVKPNGRDFVALNLNDGGARRTFFNITTGTIFSEGSGNTSTITAVGGGYYRITTSRVVAATTLTSFIEISTDGSTISYTGSAAVSLFARKAIVNRGSSALTYHATTAAAWFGVPIEYSASGFYGLVEPAATNLALYASDFTNAAWTKSNMTTALTATGPDGVANSACTLTATAGNATALQAITSGSASRVSSVFIKRRTGTGNIDVTQDNGSTWATQAVTSSWTRFSIVAATLTNPIVGIRIVTSGDAVDVWVFDHELTSVTSPKPTWGATVTRAADAPNFLLSTIPWSATQGTFIVKFRARMVDNSATARLLDVNDGTSNEQMAFVLNTPDTPDSVGLGVTDGGVSQVASGTTKSGALSLSGNKSAFFYKANDFGVSTDGGAVVADTSGTLPTTTRVDIGYSSITASRELNGRVDTIVYVPRRMTDAEVQAKTAA